MHGVSEFLNWSLRLGRVFGTEVRVNWLLGVWMLIDALNASRTQHLELIPCALAIPPVAMILHAVGHGLAARLVGGHLDQTTLSIFNNQDEIRVPLRPWSHFLVGFGGPFINLLLAGGCFLALDHTTGVLRMIVSSVFVTNLLVGVVNLLACPALDGHRWWRGLLWVFMPMHRAVTGARILSLISALLLLFYGLKTSNFLLMFMSVTALLVMLGEHREGPQDYDPVFEVDPRYGGNAPPSAWSRRRAERAEAKADAETAAEQEVLDRLLAKVSEHGLPSLTEGERKQLQAISKRQRERAG